MVLGSSATITRESASTAWIVSSECHTSLRSKRILKYLNNSISHRLS